MLILNVDIDQISQRFLRPINCWFDSMALSDWRHLHELAGMFVYECKVSKAQRHEPLVDGDWLAGWIIRAQWHISGK
jgi:hypothetical protein